jgi:hypothetical protein
MKFDDLLSKKQLLTLDLCLSFNSSLLHEVRVGKMGSEDDVGKLGLVGKAKDHG